MSLRASKIRKLSSNAAATKKQQAHARTAVGAVHQQQLQSQQQAMVFDNVGLMMYSNNNGAELGSAAAGRNRGEIEARGGQTRLLPDSPPITDASGGASSISPGSSGGASSSPFSPDQYRYVHPQEMNSSAATAAETLLIQQNPRGEMLLVNNHDNQMSQMMGSAGHHPGLGMLVWGGNGGSGCGEGDGMASAAECVPSPNSDFLSPYPPSQSRSVSHHSAQQVEKATIKFEPYLCESWNVLYDINQRPLKAMPIAVVADKGFNYSASDNCFVNQMKNHFQITVSVTVDLAAASASSDANASGLSLNSGGDLPQQPNSPFTPRYVRVNGALQPILDADFYLAFCGVKNEMQTSLIKIKQSQADRKPIDHDPEGFKIDGTRPVVRQTVARLHFAETTLNNHRKNGFLLVVKLLVSTPSGPVLVQAFHSDRVIVRQPKPIDNAVLTVYGNIVTTGTVTKPSDRSSQLKRRRVQSSQDLDVIKVVELARATTRREVVPTPYPGFPQIMPSGICAGVSRSSEEGGSVVWIEVDQTYCKADQVGKIHHIGAWDALAVSSLEIAFQNANRWLAAAVPRNKRLQQVALVINISGGGFTLVGPSASFPMCLALVSYALKRRLKSHILFTGSLSLYGCLGSVGSIHQKTIAASQSGFLKMFGPDSNLADFNRIPATDRGNVQFEAVKVIDDMILSVLED